MPVSTRRTPAVADTDVVNNTVARSGDDMDASGSLSAGTGSATHGYKLKPLIAMICFVTAVVIVMLSYARNISSTYEVVACIILELVFCLSYL
jgi:hypothetical protein